jgi:hypothetical protein
MFSNGVNCLLKGDKVELDSRLKSLTLSNLDENFANMITLLLNDRRLTTRMIVKGLNINRETVGLILTKHSGMKNVSAKMELQSLSNDQQQRRWEV